MRVSKTNTKRLTRTTRDIGHMLYNSTLQDDQQRLIDNYRDNQYLDKSKKALDRIEKAQKDYEDSSKESSFKNNIRQKAIEGVLNIILPGVVSDNLMAKIMAGEIEDWLEDIAIEKAYDNFYDAVTDGLALSQEIGSSIRDEELYYHIGIGNSRKISVFELDLDTMHKFEQDQSIFEIGKTKNGKFYFGTKEGLSGNDIIDQLIDVNAKDLTTSNMQKEWADLRNNRNITYGSGKQVRASDRFELFEASIIDSLFGTEYYGLQLSEAEEKFKHDSTSGYAAGDKTFALLFNDNVKETNYAIQSKFFNLDLDDQKRRFNITSIDSLKETLGIYSDKQVMQKLVENEIEKAQTTNRLTGEVPDDVADGAQRTEEQIYDEVSEEAVEASEDWLSENW